MSVRIIYDQDIAALFCSTSDIAFGPVFYNTDALDADERAVLFLAWLPQDARRYTDVELQAKYLEWAAQEADQIAKKEADEAL